MAKISGRKGYSKLKKAELRIFLNEPEKYPGSQRTCTLRELRKIAKEEGKKGYSKLKKTELLTLLGRDGTEACDPLPPVPKKAPAKKKVSLPHPKTITKFLDLVEESAREALLNRSHIVVFDKFNSTNLTTILEHSIGSKVVQIATSEELDKTTKAYKGLQKMKTKYPDRLKFRAADTVKEWYRSIPGKEPYLIFFALYEMTPDRLKLFEKLSRRLRPDRYLIRSNQVTLKSLRLENPDSTTVNSKWTVLKRVELEESEEEEEQEEQEAEQEEEEQEEEEEEELDVSGIDEVVSEEEPQAEKSPPPKKLPPPKAPIKKANPAPVEKVVEKPVRKERDEILKINEFLDVVKEQVVTGGKQISIVMIDNTEIGEITTILEHPIKARVIYLIAEKPEEAPDELKQIQNVFPDRLRFAEEDDPRNTAENIRKAANGDIIVGYSTDKQSEFYPSVLKEEAIGSVGAFLVHFRNARTLNPVGGFIYFDIGHSMWELKVRHDICKMYLDEEKKKEREREKDKEEDERQQQEEEQRKALEEKEKRRAERRARRKAQTQ